MFQRSRSSLIFLVFIGWLIIDDLVHAWVMKLFHFFCLTLRELTALFLTHNSEREFYEEIQSTLMRILKEITNLILFLNIEVQYYSGMVQPALAEQPWWVNLIPIPIYRPLRLHLATSRRHPIDALLKIASRNVHPMWWWSLSRVNNGDSTPSRLTPGRDYHRLGWSGSNCSRTIITFIEWSCVTK